MAIPDAHALADPRRARAAGRLGRAVWRRRYALVYAVCLFGLSRQLLRFEDAHTGYSSLILFGDHFAHGRLRRLADVPIYTYTHRDGYDGQFYAQIAVAGNPFNRELQTALDAPAYRARRILLPLAAHLLGLGRPAAILQLFALANLACLLLLAALLARWWFPPTDLHNLLRWGGVVFSAGMIVSLTRALTDGPALLLIVLGARVLERGGGDRGNQDDPGNHIWAAAALFALAALARETSVLCAAALWPAERSGPARRRALLAALLCCAPIAVWTAILTARFGRDAGLRNLAPPLSALAAKARELAAGWRSRGLDAAVRDEILIALALAVQVGFFAARPQPRQLWWRLGAPFALLAACLGWPVWEGFPSAAARALLPLSLAFHRLAPRTRGGLALLLAGNLGLVTIPDLFASIAPSEQLAFAGGVIARYGPGWLEPEYAGRDSWRWASGTATLSLENPGPAARLVTLDFELGSVTARSVTVDPASDAAARRRFALRPGQRLAVRLGPLPLSPGRTDVVFSTDAPAWREPRAGGRALAFSLHRLFVTVAPPGGG